MKWNVPLVKDYGMNVSLVKDYKMYVSLVKGNGMECFPCKGLWNGMFLL